MLDWNRVLGDSFSSRVGNCWPDTPRRAAFADGPVADTPQPVAAEAGRPVTQPDRDDLDAVRG